MSTDKKSQLINMISTLSESECNLFIKNKQHVGLLEREAKWLSTHYDSGYCRNGSYCMSRYSRDTIFKN
jgi:hypothetical protein